MKVSLQQLLAFRASTDQVARSRLSGVVNGPQAAAAASAQKAREAGPALTLLATSDTFIAESFFVTSGPLADEYHSRALAPGGLDLRAIDMPGRLLASLVQKLLQGGEGGEPDAIRRLMAMPVVGGAARERGARESQHVAGHVTLYNSDHDHANVYAVLFKPDRHEIEVALYRNAAEQGLAAGQRGEILPALPFFRQRIDITPLLEAVAQRSFGAFVGSPREMEANFEEPASGPALHDWGKRAAVVFGLAGGLAGILIAIWYAAGR